VEQARLLLWWAGMDQEPNYRALSLRLSTAPALSMPLSFRELRTSRQFVNMGSVPSNSKRNIPYEPAQAALTASCQYT
jgi:hypothetical protein